MAAHMKTCFRENYCINKIVHPWQALARSFVCSSEFVFSGNGQIYVICIFNEGLIFDVKRIEVVDANRCMLSRTYDVAHESIFWAIAHESLTCMNIVRCKFILNCPTTFMLLSFLQPCTFVIVEPFPWMFFQCGCNKIRLLFCAYKKNTWTKDWDTDLNSKLWTLKCLSQIDVDEDLLGKEK